MKVHKFICKDQISSIFGKDDFIPDTKVINIIQKVLLLPGYFTPLFLKKYSKDPKKLTQQ